MYDLIHLELLDKTKLHSLAMSSLRSHLCITNATRNYVDLIKSNHPAASRVDRVVMPVVGCAFPVDAKGAFPFFVSTSRTRHHRRRFAIRERSAASVTFRIAELSLGKRHFEKSCLRNKIRITYRIFTSKMEILSGNSRFSRGTSKRIWCVCVCI